jgi:putative membrane protein
MTEPRNEITRPRFIVEVTTNSRLAWFRAWTMLERTTSTWVLTAITLIGFGFTIVLVFDEFARFTGVEPAVRPLGPLYFGLALIGLGVTALIIAGWQYRALLGYLRQAEFASLAEVPQRSVQALVYAITIVTIFVGVFAFLAVMARVL